MFKKTAIKDLVIGGHYVAYSNKSKKLSSNGLAGVFVKVVSVTDTDVKVEVLSHKYTMDIKNISTREDAWIYEPNIDKFKVKVIQKVKSDDYPKFTDKMIEAGWGGKQLEIDISSIRLSHKEGNDGHSIISVTEDDKRATLRVGWIAPVEPPEWRIPRAERMGVGAVEIKLPPKPVSAEEQEVLTSLSAHINKLVKGANKNSCCAFSVINDENKEIFYGSSEPCHASLSRPEQEGAPKWVLSTHQRVGENITDVIRDAYISYLTNYSMFKDAFYIKDTEWIIANCYVMRTDVSANLLAGALMATRQIWEHHSHMVGWYRLMEQGIPADLAFMFGSLTSVSDGGKKAKFSDLGGSHCQFHIGLMSDECIKNAFNHNPTNVKRGLYKDSPYYEGVNAMWSKNFGNTHSALTPLRSIKVGGGGWDSAIPIDDAMEQAADIIEDWMKRNAL